jgi:hypothetical protein
VPAAAIVCYLIIGAFVGVVAFRQHRTPAWTILAWTAFWPALFVLARITDPPADMDRPYGWREIGIYFAVSAGGVAAAFLIAALLSVDVNRPFFAVSGVMLALGALVRPHWLWNHPRMQDFRVLLGESLTIAAFVVLGIVLLWVGLFTEVTVFTD